MYEIYEARRLYFYQPLFENTKPQQGSLYWVLTALISRTFFMLSLLQSKTLYVDSSCVCNV